MREREPELSVANGGHEVQNMYLAFRVGEEEYAINIAYVTEIVGMQRISQVPDVPEFIRGVINLRGKVIPVMDMRLRFGLAGRDYDARTTIIVLDLGGVPTGLVVDRVTDVVAIPAENVDPPPRWQGTGEQGVIMGLGRRDDGVSIILDVRRLVEVNAVHPDSARVAPGTDTPAAGAAEPTGT